jgi:broad specificity phosphatase PhoE
MKKTVVLFRHGQTDWNKDGRVQGQIDIPLNDTGYQQAQELAERLVGLKLEIIISSDLQRAGMTGDIVARYNAIPIHYDPRLREAHFGNFQGFTSADVIINPLWNMWQNCDPLYDTIALPHGEVKESVRKRGVETILDFVSNANYERIGISSHGYFIRLALCTLLGHQHPIHESRIRLSNAEYIIVEYDSLSTTWSVVPLTHAKTNYEQQVIIE